MKISLCTYLFIYHKLGKEIIDYISDHGYECIELWGMPKHFDYNNEKESAEILGYIKEKGLDISAAHSPIYKDNYKGKESIYISNINEDKRIEAINETIKLAESVKKYDVKTLVLHSSLYEKLNSTTCKDSFIKSIKELVKKLSPMGIKLALENEPDKLSAVSEIYEVAKQFNKKEVGICVDVAHSNITGDNICKEIERVIDRLLVLHISDNDGKDDQHLTPFKGNIDFKEIIKTLSSLDYKGYIDLEIRDPFKGSVGNLDDYNNIFRELSRFKELVETS